ncbi:MAG: T9SS type A sorting domain-containing protein [Flavobacteriales bacterium]|nr:T9SS type A sorting domain-containing protein [Flavobacteriales bacterium]
MTEIKYNLIFIIILFSCLKVTGQNDSIIVYDVNSQVSSSIAPVWFDNTITFDNTANSFGLMNQVPLNLTAPTSNVYNGTNFTRIERAAINYSLVDYPISAAIRIFYYNQDTLLDQGCSGILISENLVLTAAHCIRNYNAGSWQADSIVVASGYDDGAFNPVLQSSDASKYYLFKSYYAGLSPLKDFALLELSNPIGQQSGWVGLAFSADTSYYANKFFHKLSYPYDASMIDTSIHVNGDTLYYNYGEIDVLSNTSIGLISSEARLIPGQSGSSLFYTDNSDYYSMAIAIYSAQYNHFRITNEIFYQFKHVIDNYSTNSLENVITKEDFNVYPNPFSDIVTVEFSNINKQSYTISIYNSIGVLVGQEITSLDQVQFDVGDFNTGLFIIRLTNSDGLVTSKKVIKE